MATQRPRGNPVNTNLRKERPDDVALDVREAIPTSLVLEGQPLVVDAEQVEQRGLEVVDVHRVAHDVVPELVGLAVRDAALHAAAGHPDRERSRMVIPPVVVDRQLALRVVGAAELAAPDHERMRQHGKATLDDVMRGLWSRCKAGPMSEADLLTVLEELTGRSYATEVAQWVHSTDELPLAALLAAHGVSLKPDTAQLAQRLGIRVAENHSVQIKTVLRGSAAEQAGLAAGDEWLGLRVKEQAWRISKLDDVAFYAGPHTKLVAVVARDGRLLELPLTLPAAVPPGGAAQGKARRQPQPDTVTLTTTDTAAASRWLGGAA